MSKLKLITDEKQRLYFTGFCSTAGYVLIFEEKKYLVIDNRYYYAAKEILEKKGITVKLGSDYSFLKDFIAENKIDELGIDFSVTTVKQYGILEKICANITDICSEVEQIMAIKRDDELENIRISCGIAEKSFMEILPIIRRGITEKEVAAQLEYRFKINGAGDKSFDTIVAFGENAAVPHHETCDRKLKDNECVLIDFGCTYNGYCSDMTRTFYFGMPSEEFKEAYKSTLKAHNEALNGIKEGMSGAEADEIARNVLKEACLDKYFTHSLGHGIGVNIHEFPWLSPKGDMPLKNGMVFSDEPGVYLDGKFGIRIEDSCYMTGGIVKSFMTLTKELFSVSDGKMTICK